MKHCVYCIMGIQFYSLEIYDIFFSAQRKIYYQIELNARQTQYKRLALHLQLDCNSTICLLLPLFTLNTKHIEHEPTAHVCTYSGKRNKKINFAFKKSLNPPLKCSPESHKGTLFNQHFRRGLDFYARQILCSSSSFGSPLLYPLFSKTGL